MLISSLQQVVLEWLKQLTLQENRHSELELVIQRLEPAGKAVEYLAGQVTELRSMWQDSGEYWNGGEWAQMDEYEDQCQCLKQAWEEWHRACMEWLETALEVGIL